MANKRGIFSGLNLADIAATARDKPATPPAPTTQAGQGTVVVPAAELAISGRTVKTHERESIFRADPKRCRAWRYHNRSDVWFTEERSGDLITSMRANGQQEYAIARRVTEPDFDYELIYGMRRRYACEVLNMPLLLRVVDVDDTQAAVLMHVENANRQDITPMERAMSFLAHLEAKLFETEEAMAKSLNWSKAQMHKMLRAAELMQHPQIGLLFTDRHAVAVEGAYKLAAQLEKPAAKEVILNAAKNLSRKDAKSRNSREVLKYLLDSLNHSRKYQPLSREYTLANGGSLTVTRSSGGRVTLAFPKGVRGVDSADVVKQVEAVLKDFA